MHRRRPVAVAVEERTADSAVEDAVERLMVRLRPPLANELAAIFEASNPQSLVVGRSAAEAAVIRGVSLLNAFHLRENATTSGKKSWKRRSSSARESIS